MIFSATDRERMAIAADFRWWSDERQLTLGITPQLVGECFTAWLDSNIDNIIERRNSETRTSCVDS